MTTAEALADLHTATKIARDALHAFDICTCEDEPLAGTDPGATCPHLEASNQADARVTDAATTYLIAIGVFDEWGEDAGKAAKL